MNGNGKSIVKTVGGAENPFAPLRGMELQTKEIQLPPWMAAMREAMANSIKPADLAKIMEVQVGRAMDGDERAARFVFDQAAKISAPKGMTVIQNNFFNSESRGENEPTAARPGSAAKIDLMRERHSRGEPLTRGDDAGCAGHAVDLS